MDGGLAAAGWYPDPAGTTGTDRYWDGTAWTTQLRATPDQANLSYPPPTGPPPRYAQPAYPPASTGTQGPEPSGWPGAGHPPLAGPGPQPPGFAGPGVHGQPVVAPKNPAVSLIVSFFLPGVGSMINGDGTTGAAILIIWLLGLVLTLFIFGAFIAFGAWVWGSSTPTRAPSAGTPATGSSRDLRGAQAAPGAAVRHRSLS